VILQDGRITSATGGYTMRHTVWFMRDGAAAHFTLCNHPISHLLTSNCGDV
jgi:hypothetical protein